MHWDGCFARCGSVHARAWSRQGRQGKPVDPHLIHGMLEAQLGGLKHVLALQVGVQRQIPGVVDVGG